MSGVSKVLTFKNGGTVIVTLDAVRLFDAEQAERDLLDSIGQAIRKYETVLEAEARSKAVPNA